MLNRLGPLPRFILGRACILALLALVAGLWLWLPVMPRRTWSRALDWDFTVLAARELVISPTGQTLAAADNRGENLHLWDVSTGEKLGRQPVLWRGRITPDWFLPDGRNLIFSRYPHPFAPIRATIATGGFSPGPEWATFGHWVSLDAVSSDGQRVAATHWWTDRATGKDRDGIKVWDLTTGKELPGGPRNGTTSLGIAKAPDGQILALLKSEDGSITLWELLSRSKRATFKEANMPELFDGTLVVARGKREAQLWDPSTGKLRAALPYRRNIQVQQSHEATGRVYVNDDKYPGEHIEVWDIAPSSVQQRGTLPWLGWTHYSPDGRWLVMTCKLREPGSSNFPFTGAGVNRLELWDLTALKHRHTIVDSFRSETTYDPPWVTAFRTRPSVRFAPDSATLAARTSEPPDMISRLRGRNAPIPVVRLWETATGKVLATLRDCEGFTYFPDGKSLATWSADGTIRIWDLPPRRPWWIDYGLPVMFTLLVLLGVRLVWSALRRKAPTEATSC